jgi:hypothetical protein
MFKKEPEPIIFKLLQKLEREVTLPNSFYDPSITLILKPDKDMMATTKNWRPIVLKIPKNASK